MTLRSLPRYRGRPDPGRGRGEPGGHGRTSSTGLRDLVVLSVMIIVGFPIVLGLLVKFWVCHRNAELSNLQRERQMERDIRRGP